MQQVSYTLTIADAPASAELLAAVREIEVEDHAELADMLRLKLAVAVREDGSAWDVLDENLFQRLTRLRIDVTVGSRRVPLTEAYVIETRSEFSNAPGGSMLEVVAMDPTSLMNLEEKVRPWPDMADSDIASTIFGEYGFAAQVDQTQPTRQELDRTVMQRGTDIQFLRHLAERNGFECYVELNENSGAVEGHFHAPRSDAAPQGVLTVNMGTATNVNQFKASFDMLGPVTAEARNVDVGNQSDQDANIETQADELGEQASTPSDQPRRVLVANTGLAEAGELQTYAQAVVDRAAWAIRAEGELSTVTYGGVLRAKRPVNVRGAGRQFSGTYYVEKVLHRLSDEGYTQSFTLRRNATGVTGREDFTDNQALAS
ncbi:MAG TPA: phage late control D family protein [Gammaproteobacteria bacterium]|nr:phage late control D family protein [Gammaproteobacteria bacterium]